MNYANKRNYSHLDCIYSDDLAYIIARNIHNFMRLSKKDSLLKSGPIVDLGCGSGAVLSELKKVYPLTKAIGIDRRPTYRFEEDISYKMADIARTGLDDESVLVVLTVNMYDYLGDSFSREDFFKEVNRILVPGGVYIPSELDSRILTVPFKNSGYTSHAADFILEKPV